MIPDTSGQDTLLTSPAQAGLLTRRRLAWLLAAGIAALAVVLLLSGWLGSERSVDVARQRILAQKQRLVARRDADEAEVARLGAARILQRTEGGYKAGAIAEVDFLRAQDALKSAEIRSRQAGQASGLEIQDVALETSTKLNELQRQRLTVADTQRRVDELNVRSPVDGVIGTLSVADRSVVAANTALMTVVDLSQLEVELEIPESYADDLGLGMSAEVTIGAVTANGKLSALSKLSVPAITTLSPGCRPDRISTADTLVAPIWIGRRVATLPAMT
jgi:multidrug resistance efflux pump